MKAKGVTGDLSQSDLPGGRAESLGAESLGEALSLLEGVEGVARFTEQGVVRHALVGRIVGAYNRAGETP